MLVTGGTSDCDGGDQCPNMSGGPPRQTPVPSGKYAGDESVSCPGGVDGLNQVRRDQFLPFSHHRLPRFRGVDLTGDGTRFEQVGTEDVYFGHQLEEVGPRAMLKVSNIQRCQGPKFA